MNEQNNVTRPLSPLWSLNSPGFLPICRFRLIVIGLKRPKGTKGTSVERATCMHNTY